MTVVRELITHPLHTVSRVKPRLVRVEERGASRARRGRLRASSSPAPTPLDPLLEQLHAEQRERVGQAPSRRERVVEIAAGALLVAVCAVLWLFAAPAGDTDPATVALLVVAYAACWQVTFAIGPGTTTPLQVVFVPMWFAVEPALLPLVVAAGGILGNVVSSARDGANHPWRRAFIAIGDAWYAVGPAAVLVVIDPGAPSLSDAPIYLLVLASQFLSDWLSGTLRVWAAAGGRRPPSDLSMFGWMWMVDAALAPIGLLLALAVESSPWAVLTVVPLVGLLAQFAKERDDRILKALELSHAYRGTAQLMGDVLEADDAYTGGEHTQGVVELSLAVGQRLGLSAASMRDLEFGALLHDIGKLRVPNEIINKPGKLNDEEWAVIKEHPRYGQEMLDRVGGALGEAGVIVRAHHERWDGGGYPDGLVGEGIPIEARIITVCDSFSAMTTNRSYRRGMSHAEAVEELERCSGTQFDPAIVATLKRVLAALPKRPTLVKADGTSDEDGTGLGRSSAGVVPRGAAA